MGTGEIREKDAQDADTVERGVDRYDRHRSSRRDRRSNSRDRYRRNDRHKSRRRDV